MTRQWDNDFNDNDSDLDLRQGDRHGDQAQPEVGQGEVEDQQVPERELFRDNICGKCSCLLINFLNDFPEQEFFCQHFWRGEAKGLKN